MSNWLDPGFYLNMKLKQLGTTAAELGISNENDLAAFISNAGMTLEQHYLQAGRAEGLTPNVYFNESEYLACKLAQLQETPATAGDWAGKGINALRDLFSSMGMSAVEHYESFGAFETRADGTLLNPSNAFDANAYMQAKLHQLQATDPGTYGSMSTAELVQTFQGLGFTPAAHADMYGRAEGAQSGMAMIQAVPDAQRVSSDPGRDAYGMGVPSNPVEPSSGPNVTAPQTVANAFDISSAVPHPDSVTVPSPTPPSPMPDPTPPAQEGAGADDLFIISTQGNVLSIDFNEASPNYANLLKQYDSIHPSGGNIFTYSPAGLHLNISISSDECGEFGSTVTHSQRGLSIGVTSTMHVESTINPDDFASYSVYLKEIEITPDTIVDVRKAGSAGDSEIPFAIGTSACAWGHTNNQEVKVLLPSTTLDLRSSLSGTGVSETIFIQEGVYALQESAYHTQSVNIYGLNSKNPMGLNNFFSDHKVAYYPNLVAPNDPTNTDRPMPAMSVQLVGIETQGEDVVAA